MVEVFTVEAGDISRAYRCGSPQVAAKKFLNYLRLYRETVRVGRERPTKLTIRNERGETFQAEVEWYYGKLQHSSFEGAEGEWWRLLTVKRG